MPFRSLMIKPSAPAGTPFVVLALLAVATLIAPSAMAGAPGAPPERGWLGVGIRELAEPVAAGLPAGAAHVEVEEIYPGSGAAVAGVEVGDVVLSIDGQAVATTKELIGALETKLRGDVVRLVLWRGAARRDLEVTLGARPDFTQMAKDRIIDQPLPADLSFVDLATGKTVTLGSLRGRPVLLEYWATYCGPCKKIVPWLAELERRHGKDGLVILNVTAEDKEDVTSWLEGRKGYDDARILLDPEHVMRERLGLRSLPSIVYVDRDGVARSLTVGAVPFEEMQQHVASLLERPAGDKRPAGTALPRHLPANPTRTPAPPAGTAAPKGR